LASVASAQKFQNYPSAYPGFGKGFASQYNVNYMPLPYAPNGVKSVDRVKDAFIEVNGTIEASEGYVYCVGGEANVYSTGGGVITAKSGADTATYQIVQGGSEGKNANFVSLATRAGVLQNADGSDKTVSTTDFDTYTYINGKWHASACDGNFNSKETVSDVSCTVDGVTKVSCACGYSYEETVPALGHKYESVVTAPTCTEKGYTTNTCSVCDDVTVTNEKVALGHKYTEEILEQPTCTVEGVRKLTCSVCNHSYTERIEKSSHTPGDAVVENQKASTCTIAGSYDLVTYCTVCGQESSRTTVITDPLGHTEGEVETRTETKAPTCTEDGSEIVYEDTYCSVCNQIAKTEKVSEKTLAATGHDYKEEITKSPTCTIEGIITFTCANCDDSYTEAIAATGHTVKDTWCEAKAPTCTEDGWKEYLICTVCGQAAEDIQYIDALGHDWDTPSAVDVTKVPTCEQEGEKVITCGRTDCGETKTETISALGHNYTSAVTDPTCTEAGYTTHTCSNCGDSYTDTPVAATGHDYKEEITKEATCTINGEKTFTCNTCGYSYTEVITAKGHNPVTVPGYAPTCTNPGLTDGTKCDTCGAVVKAQEEIPVIDHSYDDGAETKAPTCTEKGVKTFTCTVCGHTYTEEIAAKGHTEEILPAVAPDCENTGLTEGKKCSVCGETLTAQTVVPALGHSYDNGVETTAPTCTEKGVKTFTCSVCGDTKTEEIVAKGHNYESAVTAPTCEEVGYTTHTCTVCGDTYKDSQVAMLGHKNVTVAAKDATCTEDGFEAYVYCSVCDKLLSDKVVIPATGHSYDNGVDTTKPTCTTEGVKTFTCATCGNTYTEPVAALGHKYSSVVTKPTCENEGYTTYTCTVCGDSYVDDEVAALGHTEGETVVENEVAATCTENGSYDNVVYCTVCNAELSRATVTVDALGHTEGKAVVENEVAATCTTDGSYDNVVYCTVCNAELSRDTVTVDALGHKYDAVVTAPTCTAKGYTTYTCTVCGDSYVDDEVAALGHTEG
ncbi:MAG: hypothetical protein IKJ05_07915, partial [Oscillospiraceae bacterium]|nr:hypothetical protein [Oscillospiraceae bacterium]